MSGKMKAVYQIIESEKLEKPIWRRIGTAFVNADDSINVYVDSLPLQGKMQVRDLPPKTDEQSEAA